VARTREDWLPPTSVTLATTTSLFSPLGPVSYRASNSGAAPVMIASTSSIERDPRSIKNRIVLEHCYNCPVNLN
jgi:hypothetical protein